MGGFFESLGVFWRAPDSRPTRQVDGDIEEELRFHLAERERENRAAGMSAEQAREEAQRRFGDFERVRDECRRVQLGERIVLQRINLVILTVLLTAVVVLGWQSFSAQRESRESIDRMRAEVAQLNAALAEKGGTIGALMAAEARSTVWYQPAGTGVPDGSAERAALASDGERAALGYVGSGGDARHPEEDTADEQWNQRFGECSDDWRHGLAVAQRLADECSCERAVEVLDAIYAILSEPHREQLFKPFVFHGGKPCALRILHFGATDPEPAVRARAYAYLRDYAFRDLGEDYEGYLAWYHRFGARPLAEVFVANASEFVERALAANGAELDGIVRNWRGLDFRAAEAAGVDLVVTFRSAGAVDLATGWIRSHDNDRRLTGVMWLARLDPTEAELGEYVVPLVRGDASVPPELFAEACNALGRPQRPWAVTELLGALQESFVLGNADRRVLALSRALAATRDPRATPVLVACIVADDTQVTIEGIGANGLQQLTGVAYDPSHDGAWWRAWWEKNSGRLPEPIRGTPLPAVDVRLRK